MVSDDYWKEKRITLVDVLIAWAVAATALGAPVGIIALMQSGW